MPRKDRRFSGEDLRRLYCKNLTPTQRRLFDITVCDWSDYDIQEKTKQIFDALFETGLIDEVASLLPRGQLLKDAFALANLVISGGDLSQIDYVPTNVWGQIEGLFQEGIDAIEALGGSEPYQNLIESLLLRI